MYVRELQVRYRLRQVRHHPLPTQRLLTPHDAAQMFVRLLGHEAVEVCGLFCLSTRQHLLIYHELSRGHLDAAPVHPREVFKAAILANAAGVILGHNHPSGDTTPSVDDLALTRRLVTAGEILGIELIDHVIVSAEGTYCSLKESGGLHP